MTTTISGLHFGGWESVIPRIESGTVAAVITDPPYGINYSNNMTKDRYGVLAGDDGGYDYSGWAREAYRILRPDSCVMAYTGWSEYPDHFRQLMTCGFSMREPLIVQKRPSGKTDLYGTFQSNGDWILFGHKGRFRFHQTELVRNKRAGTVPNKGRKPVAEFKTRFPACWFGEEYPWSTENPATLSASDVRHPTVKSVEFVTWLVLMTTDAGDTVCDPFSGSGTVALACKKTGRRFVGCEIDRAYWELSMRRISE